MTAKQFQLIRIIVVILLALMFSFAYVINNLILSLSLILMGILTLFLLRKRVDEVMIDEMVHTISGKAALAAIQIYSWLAIIVMLAANSVAQTNLVYAVIGNTLAFSVCALMMIYSAAYYFLAKSSWKDPKFIFSAILALIFIVIFILGIFMKLL